MDTALPSGVLNGDGHRALQCTAGAIDKTISVRWTRESEEKCSSKVNEDDTPEDLSNG